MVAQNKPALNERAARAWVDSVLKTLTPDEQIAQLMVVRLSSYDARNKTAIFYDEKVDSLVKQYNIGGVCLFREARLNKLRYLIACRLMPKHRSSCALMPNGVSECA